LLIYLIDNAYIVLSRQQILDHVWGTEFYDENLVNTTIKRLRKKIENSPDNPEYIQTIWGLGYMFQGEVR
jgi:DNA-binding response OmpR family regulator